MKILIDVPDNIYESIIADSKRNEKWKTNLCGSLCESVANGKVISNDCELIDGNKAIIELNKYIAKHDESLIKSGLATEGENNQIPLFMWSSIINKCAINLV